MYNALFTIYLICYFYISFMVTLIAIVRYIILNVGKFNLIILGYISKIKNIGTILFNLIILFIAFCAICNITFLLIFIPFIFFLIILYIY